MLIGTPADGVPAPIEDTTRLADAVAALATGEGPIAIDAERASGYRYSQRAYLVQLRRHGVGTFLIDPIACPDLSSLGTGTDEWILHAASQDLACLRECGMTIERLFDTELAGRLLGYPRVGLASMLERMLGVTLAKGHSAADWSTRPLPHDWLEYAALDVELLLELREALETALDEAGKLEWARQEFEAVAAAPGSEPRTDPWRRTSGMHRIKSRRQLATLRELWVARDRVARHRDLAPGRVLQDKMLVEIALAGPASRSELARLPVFARSRVRGLVGALWPALAEARGLRDSALPPASVTTYGPPATNRWAERDPKAADRLSAARASLAELSERVAVPVENLLSPDAVRRLAWEPPVEITDETVAAALRDRGARPWQVELTTALLARAIAG